MSRNRASTSVSACVPSPQINISLLEAAEDISFEAYKQPKNSNNRKRSFSPIVNFRSPDISPIAMIEVGTTFRIPASINTPEVKQSRAAKWQKDDTVRRPGKGTYNNKTIPGPEKRKVPYMIGTPLAKRELEHRISVGNILRDLNLAKYIGIFNDEEINFEVFLTLSEKDLHDIGIDCQRDIELILGKVAEYNAGL
ncbi:uncharacterized protein LOC115258092 isoform X1 [Aedes albopictus]|uniref:SAM domain-containing protein n=1 Tax=Aedes albopictus TaxID=7160 RepID=A0ABM1Z2X0_AEDAL|nr:uncharacterized protein LOC115258092 [Aedes albopictus]